MQHSSKNRLHKVVESGTAEVAGEVDALKSSIGQLRSDVVELFNHAFGIGRGGAHAAKDVANDAMDELKSKIADLNDRGKDQIAAMGTKIEQNPVPAALIAFGIGFVAAKLFSRR